MLWTIFEGSSAWSLDAMREHSGASVYEIAFAMYLCKAEHARAVDWINQGAAPPETSGDGADSARLLPSLSGHLDR